MYPLERLGKTAVDFMGGFLKLVLCPEWRCSLDLKRWLDRINYPIESATDPPATVSPSEISGPLVEVRRVETEQHRYIQTPGVEALLVGEGSAVPAGEHANRNAASSLPIPHHALYVDGSQGLMHPYESVRRFGTASSVRSRASGQRGDSSELTGLGTSLGALMQQTALAQKKEICL